MDLSQNVKAVQERIAAAAAAAGRSPEEVALCAATKTGNPATASTQAGAGTYPAAQERAGV